jgi:hypothetical protein
VKPTPRSLLIWLALAMAPVSLGLTACPRTVPSATAPVGDVSAPANRAAVLNWVRDLGFVNADGSQWRAYFPAGTSGTFLFQRTTASLLPCDSLLPRGALIGRIITPLRFDRLGLSADTSYVFVDSVSTGWRGIVIPASLSAPAAVHRLIRHAHMGGAPPAPLAFGFALCMACCRSWCQFPTDSI